MMNTMRGEPRTAAQAWTGVAGFEMKAAPAAAPARKSATEHLSVRFEIKADTLNESERTFQGLASTWALDYGNDQIHPGAYLRTLQHWKDSDRVIPLIDLHGGDTVRRVVGKVIAAEETAEGLLCTFQVIKSDDPSSPDADADACWRRIKGRYVTGLSIGYRAVRYEFEQPEGTTSYWDRIRHLYELALVEVSLVIFGMQAGALIDTDSASAAKSLADALRTGTLTEQHKAELRALLDAPSAPAPDGDPAPPADAPKGLAPDAHARLQQRLLGIKIRGLTTRR